MGINVNSSIKDNMISALENRIQNYKEVEDTLEPEELAELEQAEALLAEVKTLTPENIDKMITTMDAKNSGCITNESNEVAFTELFSKMTEIEINKAMAVEQAAQYTIEQYCEKNKLEINELTQDDIEEIKESLEPMEEPETVSSVVDRIFKNKSRVYETVEELSTTPREDEIEELGEDVLEEVGEEEEYIDNETVI